MGDSVAVNGCFLTAVGFGEGRIRFDVLEEAHRLTNFGELTVENRVSLELSLRVNTRLGGHFVADYNDAVRRVEIFGARSRGHYLHVRFPEGFGNYVVYNGSIEIDGALLTAAQIGCDTLDVVWLILHTLAATILPQKRVGSAVNLELDLLAKYVEKLSTSSQLALL